MRQPSEEALADNQELRLKRGYAPNPFCIACHGIGWLHPRDEQWMLLENKEVYCTAKDCMAESYSHYRQTHQYLELKGVTLRLQTFSQFKIREGNKSSFEAFKALAEGKTDKPFLFSYGKTGNGKTHLSQALTTVLNQRGINTHYYTIPELFGILKEAISDNSVDSWIDGLQKCPGLVLDDFGSETYSDFGLGKLQEIIDVRWTGKLITVMCTNKDLIGTPENRGLQMISTRIYSRMCDQDLSVVVLNEGDDFRTNRRHQLEY